MQPLSGESGLMVECGRTDADEMNPVAACFKVLMENKYQDAILLFSVAAAFGFLLIVSSMG
jgi:hypothetical protein